MYKGIIWATWAWPESDLWTCLRVLDSRSQDFKDLCMLNWSCFVTFSTYLWACLLPACSISTFVYKQGLKLLFNFPLLSPLQWGVTCKPACTFFLFHGLHYPQLFPFSMLWYIKHLLINTKKYLSGLLTQTINFTCTMLIAICVPKHVSLLTGLHLWKALGRWHRLECII